MNLTNFLLFLLLAGVGYVGFLFSRKTSNLDESEDDFLKKKIGELEGELKIEKSKKDELIGKNKQMFALIESLKGDNKALGKERDGLQNRLSKFEAELERKDKEFEDRIKKLNVSKEALDEERRRVIREDEDKQLKEKLNRDRMWAEHEERVKSRLTELCKQPQYGFTVYDNNNLPGNFDGKFKPDFMIEFLGQYVIFDAKVSRSDNLQNYISTTVKSTAKKIHDKHRIYPAVFFVVPTEVIGSLGARYYFENGYEFFVIAPESVEIVLSSLKKISGYEFAEQMDPRDRDNIVTLIAEFDYHISFRNAIDVLSAQRGVEIISKAQKLKPDLRDEIALIKGKMSPRQFTPTDINVLMTSPESQQDRIHQLISPKISVKPEDIHSAKRIIG